MRHEIPILDLGPYLGGATGARERVAAELGRACQETGFFFISGHGVAPDLVDRVFAASAEFHGQPLAAKEALPANEHNIGYMAYKASISRASKVYEGERKPNLVAAFFLKRDLAPEHPDVVANKRFRGLNQWPPKLPGFRETCVAYMTALEELAKSMLPLSAIALDLEPDFFDQDLAEPQFSLRLSQYPPAEPEDNQFGLAAHTDSSFLTLLAQNQVPGLQIRRADGEWIDAPVLADTFLVNSGDMLRRWSNHRFLSTPHRAMASAPDADRYAIPFFFDASIDYPMHCLPSCQGPDNPPRYEPTTYADYMLWFARQNYAHFKEAEGQAAE